MSTTMPASERGLNSFHATPETSGTLSTVILASSSTTVTPETTGSSMISSSFDTQVPGLLVKLERT